MNFFLALIILSSATLCYSSCGYTAGKLIDLTYPFDENTLYWVDMKTFRFSKKIVSDQNFFYSANDFEAGEHGGTHLDAPYHFSKDGWKVGDIPLERFFVNGIKIDAKAEVANNSNYGLEVRKLEEWEKKNGKISCPTVVLLDFGWAKYYPNKNQYFGSDTLREDDLNFPGISPEAARWLAANEHVVGVGLDTASIDTGKNSVNPQAHISLCAANKYLLENVALNGVDLPEKDFKLFVTPMKIKEGTGAPCRIIASINKNHN